jgi:hypothetical protein
MNASPMAPPQALGERITVSLILKAGDDLRRLQERTNLSKTDLINRAITLYEFFDAQLRADHDLIARDNRTGQTHLVRLVDVPAGQLTSTGPALSRPDRADRRGQPDRRRDRQPSTTRSGDLTGTDRRFAAFGLAAPELRTR